MSYSKRDFEQDLADPEMPHIRSREHFEAFYDQLALGEARKVTYPAHRMDWISLTKGGWVIELGCHVGYDLVHWLYQDPELTAWGVDVSQNMLAEADRRLMQSHPGKRWVLLHSFIEDLEVPSNAHQITDVVLTETLEHVQDPHPVLAKAVELAHYGTLWITVPQTRWGNFSHVRGISTDEMWEMLRSAGATKGVRVWGKSDGLTYATVTQK